MLALDGNSLNGELSRREQTMAALAVKISTTNQLTNGARLDHLRAYNLDEAEINTVLKLATIFHYWREHSHLAPRPPEPETPQEQLTLGFGHELPYYFEGTSPTSALTCTYLTCT